MAQAALVRAGAFPAPGSAEKPARGGLAGYPLAALPTPPGRGRASASPDICGSFVVLRWPCLRRQPYGPAFSSGAHAAPHSSIQTLRFRDVSSEQTFGTSLNALLTCAEQTGIYKSSRRFLEISFSQLDSSSWQRPPDSPPPSGGQQPAHAKCAYFCLVFCSHVDGSGFVSKK